MDWHDEHCQYSLDVTPRWPAMMIMIVVGHALFALPHTHTRTTKRIHKHTITESINLPPIAAQHRCGPIGAKKCTELLGQVVAHQPMASTAKPPLSFLVAIHGFRAMCASVRTRQLASAVEHQDGFECLHSLLHPLWNGEFRSVKCKDKVHSHAGTASGPTPPNGPATQLVVVDAWHWTGCCTHPSIRPPASITQLHNSRRINEWKSDCKESGSVLVIGPASCRHLACPCRPCMANKQADKQTSKPRPRVNTLPI